MLLFLPLVLVCVTYPNIIVGAQQVPKYYLQISAVDYPSEVPINLTFRITVVLNYSLPMLSGYSTYPSRYFITARLYNSTGSGQDPPAAQSLLATSDIEDVWNSGSHLFYLMTKAPSYPTTIHLTIYAMYQPISPFTNSYPPSVTSAPNDKWTYTHAAGSEVEVSINIVQNVPVYLSTNKPDIPVTIDGYHQLETGNSGSLIVKLAVLRWHTIAVPAVVNLGDGTHEAFVSWQNGSNSTLLSLFLRSAIYLNATYKTQFLLTVNGNKGSGWYDEGSYAEVNAVSETQANRLLGLIGFTEVFKGWSGDVQSNSITVKLLMNAPHQINAERMIRYRPSGIKIVLTMIILLMLVIVLTFLVTKSRRNAPKAFETSTPM